MRLIPVIDLKDGHVVQAVAGRRNTYRKVQSPFSASTTLKDVAIALIKEFQAETIYIADLNAITGEGTHTDLIAEFCTANPHISVLLDDGRRTLPSRQNTTTPPNVAYVLGSETFDDLSGWQQHLKRGHSHCLLSLDFKGGQFLGDKRLLDEVELWPEIIIVMTLDVVGTSKGPDIETVSEIVARAGRRNVFAAGGVRSVDDLQRLALAGAAGALVSTALHQRKIKTGDLEKIAGF